MKMTEKDIRPDLIAVVKMFGKVHYKQATQTLIRRGVWGDTLPDTPENTVNNCFTTSKDERGLPVFEQVESGTYQLRPVYY